MERLQRISIVAVAILSAASGTSAAQQAATSGAQNALETVQTFQTIEQLDSTLLLPYSTYLTTPAGQSLLSANLATVIAINKNATPAQQIQALHDNISINASNQQTGAVVADGLGPRLNTAFDNAIVANTPPLTAPAPAQPPVNAFQNALQISGVGSGFAKSFFAQGLVSTALPNPPTALTQYLQQIYATDPTLFTVPVTFPPGGVADVNTKAYAGSVEIKHNPGDPRPFLVRPNVLVDLSGPSYDAPSAGTPASLKPNRTSVFESGIGGEASFPSGHSTFGNTAALLLAIAIPERFQQELTRGSEFQFSRNVLGVHYPMDSIAGRIIALRDAAYLLSNEAPNDPQYATQFSQFSSALRATLSAGCGGTIAACSATGQAGDRFNDAAQNRADYMSRLTYDLPSVGPTNLLPIVPTDAPVLLATRFPYLSAQQRSDVLASTELPSGVPLDDGTGWARLNLYDAANGYASFASTVTVVMNAADSGFSANDTWSNDISGPGGLVKQGSGTLALTGANTYLGGTQVAGGVLAVNADTALGNAAGTLTLSGGTLQALASFASPRTIILAGPGGSIDTNGNAVALSGAISGSGGLTAFGGGELALSGTNSFSGDVQVNAATLLIGTDQALGAPANRLVLNDAALSLSGPISSSRGVVIGAGGAVIDTASYLTTLSGPLTVGGPLLQVGAGQLTLAGSTSGPGSMVVASGQLNENGSLGIGSLQVSPGATLRGTGTIDTPTAVEGVLAPGNSPGTLNFTQPLTLLPGSTLRLDVDGSGINTGSGNTSRLVSSSSIVLNGVLQPLLRGIGGDASNAYTPSLGQVLPVIQAAGGISGAFTGLVQPAAGLAPGTRFDALYGNTALALVVTPAAYANLAAAGLTETANQRAVGRVLDSVRPEAGTPAETPAAALVVSLYPLPGTAIGPALDRLGGNIYGDTLLNDMQGQRLVMDAVSDQLSGLRDTTVTTGNQVAAATWDGTMWLRGIGQWSHLSSAGAPGYSANLGGVVAGADVRLGGSWVAGMALAYTGGSLSAAEAGSADTQTLHLTAYTGWTKGILFADAQAGGSWSDNRIRRDLTSLTAVERGVAYGTGVFGAGHVGLMLHQGTFHVQPTLGLSVQHFDHDSLDEDANSAAALIVNGAGLTSVRSEASVRIDRPFVLPSGVVVAPAVRVGWRHEFADTNAATTSTLTGFAAPIVVTTASIGRDALVSGASLTARITPQLALDASYDADLRQNFTSQTVKAGLRLTW